MIEAAIIIGSYIILSVLLNIPNPKWSLFIKRGLLYGYLIYHINDFS
jgi:hypothetical protein